MKRLLIALVILTLTGCDPKYNNEGDAVYYEYWNEANGSHKDKIEEADPKTFRILKFRRYAKDKKNVFYNGGVIAGADVSTFEAIDAYFARDKNTGYYCSDSVKSSDGKTFKRIEDDYSTDGKDVFYRTNPLKVESVKKFRFLYASGGDSWEWATDDSYYYYESNKVPSDDYANMTVYKNSGGISKDRHWVYFRDHKLNYNDNGKRVVDTIDAASFTVTDYLKCHDKFGCFNAWLERGKCE